MGPSVVIGYVTLHNEQHFGSLIEQQLFNSRSISQNCGISTRIFVSRRKFDRNIWFLSHFILLLGNLWFLDNHYCCGYDIFDLQQISDIWLVDELGSRWHDLVNPERALIRWWTIQFREEIGKEVFGWFWISSNERKSQPRNTRRSNYLKFNCQRIMIFYLNTNRIKNNNILWFIQP